MVLPERVVGALVEGRDHCETAPVRVVVGRAVQQVTVEEEGVAGAHLDQVPGTDAGQMGDPAGIGGRLLPHRHVHDPAGPVGAPQHLPEVTASRIPVRTWMDDIGGRDCWAKILIRCY